MIRDHFGISIPSALPPVDEQETGLLRLLGRLEMLTLEQIQQAAFPHMTRRGVVGRLEAMLRDEVLWRTPTRITPAGSRTSSTKLKTAYAYGLTHTGKALLDTLEVEADETTMHRLRSRDPRGRKPDARTLAHDLQVSWWTLNLLLEASRNRLCRSVYAQVEFISETRQRMDALVILRLSPIRPRAAEEIGPIPWFDGTPRAEDEIDVRLALEVDRGTEELVVLLKKGAAYRDLSLDGTYMTLLGGLVLPVFLAPSVRRVRQIATEYRDIWPDGWGIISTPQSAADSTNGTLWGRYWSLTIGQPFPLLTTIPVGPDGRVCFETVCSLERWQQHLVDIPVVETPEQQHGRAGGLARAARRRALQPQPPVEETPSRAAAPEASA